jgi:hypothetical protein
MFFAFKAMGYEDEYGEEAAANKHPFIIELCQKTQGSDLVRDQLLHILVAGRGSIPSLFRWNLWASSSIFSSFDQLSLVSILFATEAF